MKHTQWGLIILVNLCNMI